MIATISNIYITQHRQKDQPLGIYRKEMILLLNQQIKSAVVVMDKTTYLLEAERQLSDCRFYENQILTLHWILLRRSREPQRLCMLVATQTIRPWSTLLQRIPSQAVSICCLKFTRKTILGDRLCHPMVTQLKRYRNLLIFTFR